MNRDHYQLGTWLMWLALPITAVNYWRVWESLPPRMAVHFDANWQPNGWTSKEGSLLFALLVTGFLLVVFTVAAYSARTRKPKSAWAVLITFYLVLCMFLLLNHWIIGINLNPQSLHTRAESTHYSLEGDRWERDQSVSCVI